jgi:hypothetical protein
MISQSDEHRTVTEIGGRGRGPGGQLAGLTLPVGACPITCCGDPIDPSRLMCRRHWYEVPRQLRDHVWTTWRSGESAASREHRDAVLIAIATCQALRPADKPAAA